MSEHDNDAAPPFALGGWLGVDEHQRKAASVFQPLSSLAPALYGSSPAADDAPILLYKAWQEVTGKIPDYPAQQIGDCVSFGHGHANDLLQCLEILHGEASEYRETSTEWIYGSSRAVAGILGPIDGSYGSAAVKAMTQWGVVSREMLGSDGAYKGSRAKSWGGWGGPPAEVKAKAAPFKLKNAAKVSTWDDLVAAIKNSYPITICSNWGFTQSRDAQGFCRASGRWAHCMFIAGVRFDRPGALICNSWGNNSPTGPRVWDQPAFSFWADRSAIEGILRADDSWALSGAADFVARPVPKEITWSLAA